MLARLGFALIAVIVAIGSVTYYRHDEAQRVEGRRFIRDFSLDQRRPAAVEDATNTQTFDNMNAVLTDAALRDALGSINFNDFPEDERRLWIEAVMKTDEELEAARRLALHSVEARPGWPFHQGALGEIVFAQQRRDRELAPAAQAKWLLPLTTAAADSPGNDSLNVYLAASVLERYPVLDVAIRRRAAQLVRRAFVDPKFVARAFTPVATILGDAAAVGALPNDALAIDAALRAEERAGDVNRAALLLKRWEVAELASRAKEVAEIERALERHNDVLLRPAVQAFLNRHRVEDFDTEKSRRQWLEVLDAAVAEGQGSWESDRRADIVRHFLSGRVDFSAVAQSGRNRESLYAPLLDAVDSLSAVPEVVRARTSLAAGDFYGAETIYRKSASAGAFEWTPFLVDLARYHAAAGDVSAARDALNAVSQAAAEECDVRVVRAQLDGVASAMHDVAVFPPDSWSSTNQLSICIDPQRDAAKKLHLVLQASAPALVDYGWDGARSGTVLVPADSTELYLPLQRLSGRRTFYVKTRVGGVVTASALVE